MNNNEADMSKKTIENELVSMLVKEKKRDRRWRNIRFFAWIVLIFLIFITVTDFTSKIPSTLFGGTKQPDKPYAALVRLEGTIMPDKDFSAENVIPSLIHAFQDKKAKGVVLLMNSPGGSAVQASLIHDKILALKKKYNKKVVVVAEDMLASGGYLISVAADEIYVDPSTITGSIGVIAAGFGFNQTISKLGIQRRVFTAGIHKDRLDSFEPLKQNDVAKMKKVLNETHQVFIDDVKKGRAGKLKGKDSELFSGDFWSGSTAVKLGLVDGTSNLWDVLKSEFDVEHYVDYSSQPSFIQAFLKNIQTKLSDNVLPLTQAKEILF
jgi:protease-4